MNYSPLTSDDVDNVASPIDTVWEESGKTLRYIQKQIEQKLSEANYTLQKKSYLSSPPLNDKSFSNATSTLTLVSPQHNTSSSTYHSNTPFSSNNTVSYNNSFYATQITPRITPGAVEPTFDTTESPLNSFHTSNNNTLPNLCVVDAPYSSNYEFTNLLLGEINNLMNSSGEIIKRLESFTPELNIQQVVQIRRYKTIFSSFWSDIFKIKEEASINSKKHLISEKNSSKMNANELLSDKSIYSQEKNVTSSAISMVETLIEQGSQTLSTLSLQHQRLSGASLKLSNMGKITKKMGNILKKIDWTHKRHNIILAALTFFCILLFLWLAIG